jgi:low temperature requirement protein LtrA
MLIATVPTQRPKLHWPDVIRTKEDYQKMIATGLFWVYFDGCEEEIKEYLKEKEKEVVAD